MLQRRCVTNEQLGWRVEIDDARGAKLGEKAADGLYRQTEVVGDVEARHRQSDRPFGWRPECDRLPPLREEERCKALACRLAPKQQNLLLRSRQCPVSYIDQPPLHRGEPAEQGGEAGACDATDAEWLEGFGTERIGVGHTGSDQPPGTGKLDDLPPSIRHQLEDRRRAMRDDEEVCGRFIFLDEGGANWDLEDRGSGGQFGEIRPGYGTADGGMSQVTLRA